ncbi:hypothetical protein N7533_013235 [Penicillium manginii]|uniref:uncharacterized protein n=1 Tax=Penicillium manginii TaxID=203109 RepID=UPI002547201A|nr:uncharacterized protein N7533_013235 [Penicillium manginii]KAJ5734832.1 hypothetical protein N7533_013235 [Penicillium manginii]
MASPKTIQRWPGKLPGELANKVPTCIQYEEGTDKVKNWGFGCDHEEDAADIQEFFKLHLAPNYRGNYPGEPSRQDAQRWFTDYIQCIYQHVVSHFNATIPQFSSRQVEFLFSVPTTWKDVRMVEETRALLKRAVSAETQAHHVSIGLTEAEAAAVYAGNEHYKEGDTLIVCDSGGGTTDVNVLKLISSLGEPTRLEQLGQVEGQPIGSVFIDRHVHQIVSQNLEGIRDHLRYSPSETAWRIITGRFQRFKCGFGSEATSTPYLKLDIPGLDPGLDFPEKNIFDSQLSIAWADIQKVFDTKIDAICVLLDDHMRQMSARYPFDQIKYLILSGGFGSSPYLRERLIQKYTETESNNRSNTSEIQILVADEPQLVVVHGLVLDRVQQLKKGVITFGSRCSPMSYGIVCDKLYDAVKHISEPVRLDPRDKKTYVVDQIDWLVIQGTPIPYTGLTKQFQLKMNPGQESQPWKVHIVMSSLPPEQLPQSLRQKGAHSVCHLDIITEGVDRKLKNRHWYSMKPTFWRTVFDVKVVVGPADLSFQLWSKDKQIRSTSHEPIAVKWMPARDLD